MYLRNRAPSRVKEFSKDQWRDELNNSLVHYYVLSMRWSLMIGNEIAVKQAKGGATIPIPCLPELATTSKTGVNLVVSETIHLPYEQFNLRACGGLADRSRV